ncbi:FecR family protein [Flavobacterium sp. N1994]|uniref:FecR family protein n=1 Tax=Flavobacterium sp. N1994 TaxID=2986827 RepID=UPI0022223FB8|nr:FecR family protein [Flavobacterium sp. N1994]
MEENYKLAKWLNDEMTDKELIEFQSESDYHLYQKIRLYSSELETPVFEEQKLFSKVISAKKDSPKVISMKSNWLLRVAAVVVISFGLLFAYTFLSTSSELAENGTKTTFSLPDNSEVVLNSGSEIDYKKWNWDNNRKLNLSGEAYFRVAKGKKFEVNTPLGKVTVLGTQFNVKQRENRFDVTCYEGRVKVNYNEKEVIITKGMRVSFKDGTSIPIPENTTQKPEWLNDELVFYKEDLKDIVKELERHFNISLQLKCNTNSQLFTGTIPAQNIDLSLQVLSTTYHLQPVKVSENNIILKSVDAQK